MNTALIAACATVGKVKENKWPTYYTNFQGATYIDVKVRMYVHFRPMTIVAPIGYSYYGSIYAPYKILDVRPIQLRGRSKCIQHSFKVDINKVHNISAYIKDRINDINMQGIWHFYECEMVHEYREWIKSNYNTNVSADSFDYTIQFCSEVE